MRNSRKKHIPVRIALAVLIVLLLAPIVQTVFYSFFAPSEIREYMATRNNYYATSMMEIRIFPRSFSLEQYYQTLISDRRILHFFCNSVIYTLAILTGQLLILPAFAFALSCFRFRGRDLIAFVVVLLMVLPFQVLMVPNVLTLRALNLLNTPWAVILPVVASPFVVFLLRQYMMGIPKDIIQSAQIDGARPLSCFVQIILPICRPVLGATVALSFADCWNLVEQPLTYLTLREDLYPLSAVFGKLSSNITGNEFSGAALFILPALFVYMYFQEDIIEGIQLTDFR